MLYEKDIFGTEGHTRSPEEEEEIEESWLENILEGIEDGHLNVKINQREKTVSIIEVPTGDTIFHTSIDEYEKLLREKEQRGQSSSFKSRKEN